MDARRHDFTNVYSPRSTQALFVASTSGYWSGHRIWINGKVVSDPFRRDSSQQFGGLISVRLEKEWNRVLIKTNQRHTSAQLTVYLLDQNESLSPSLRDGAAGPPRLERLAAASDFRLETRRQRS